VLLSSRLARPSLKSIGSTGKDARYFIKALGYPNAAF